MDSFDLYLIISLILIILIILIIFIFLYFFKIKENFGKKKYAVCVWGQLRGVESSIDSFNKNLCQPLNADLFVFGQKTNTNVDLNLDLYQNNIIIRELYTNPENIKELYTFKCEDKNDNFCDDRHLKIDEDRLYT